MIHKKENRILFILEHFHPYTGGVERLFYQLAKQLAEKGFHITVITTKHSREIPAREHLDGIYIRRIRARNRYLFTFMAIPSAVLSAVKCRLIQTSTYNAAIPAFIAGMLTRRPVVITVHEVWGKLWFNLPWMSKTVAWFHNLFEQMILKLPFRRFIAVSQYTANSLVNAGVQQGKVTTIMNGLDYQRLEEFKQIHKKNPQALKFVYSGRLGHSKGIDLIIEGGNKFLLSHPEAVIELIIPAKPVRLRRRVEKSIGAKPGRAGFVISNTLPYNKLVGKFYDTTALLIPSRNEGFCFAAAEAAFLGIPVITSDLGALKETAGGNIVIMEDITPEGFYNALLQASEGNWTTRNVMRFPLEDQIQQYLSLYQSL